MKLPNAEIKASKSMRGRIIGYVAQFASITTETKPTKAEAEVELARLVAGRCDYRNSTPEILQAGKHTGVFSFNLYGTVTTQHVYPEGRAGMSSGAPSMDDAKAGFLAHVAQYDWTPEQGTTAPDYLKTEAARKDFTGWAEWQLRYNHASKALGLSDHDAHRWACDNTGLPSQEAATPEAVAPVVEAVAVISEAVAPATPEAVALMRQIDFTKAGDYLNCYGSDALIVARILGLVRLTVKDKHATPEHPAGTSHTFIPVYNQAEWFAELRAAGYNPQIVEAARPQALAS